MAERPAITIGRGRGGDVTTRRGLSFGQDHSAVGRRRVETGTAGAKDPSAERVGRRREARLLRMRLLRQARMEISDEFARRTELLLRFRRRRAVQLRLLTRTEGFHPRHVSLIRRLL